MKDAMQAAVKERKDVIDVYAATREMLEAEIKVPKNLPAQPSSEEEQNRLDEIGGLQKTLETLSPPLFPSTAEIMAGVKQSHDEDEKKLSDDLEAEKQQEREKAGAAYREAQEALRKLTLKREELAKEPERIRQRINDLKNQRQRSADRLKLLDEELRPQIKGTAQTFLLVLRALFLGGLGALVTSLLRIQREGDIVGLMDSKQYFHIIIYDTIIGSVVSVTGLALAMYSNIFSILPLDWSSPDGTGNSAYWKVAFLCIVIGAFARPVYYALYRRIRIFAPDDEKNGSAK